MKEKYNNKTTLLIFLGISALIGLFWGLLFGLLVAPLCGVIIGIVAFLVGFMGLTLICGGNYKNE